MADEIPETGAVFTFGRSRFADDEPSHFFIKNDPVVAISCGDEHSAVICQNGRVFVFGGNSWGQLGLGHKDEVTRPSCVKWLKPHRAMFVACGRAHTVFVTDTNSIYTVGCNDEGQLGTGDMEHHSVPQYVELGSDGVVRQVSAGSNHTAVLTDEGRVFVCGSNTEGQLGLGEDTRSSVTFQELKFMEKIAFVECGYYHTVFITVKGAVFITGDNENNKLGIRNPAPIVYVPEVLPIETPMKSACCGASHTFLLSMDEANVFGLGSNEKGQLGLPEDVQVVTEPTELDIEKMFDGFQLKLVACGAMHTAFVTDNGLLYTCGESRHNKLCLDPLDETEDTNNTNDANQYSPKRVIAMDDYIVDNVACGGCHTLLTATKDTSVEDTNDTDINKQDSTSRLPMTELPPLKVPTNMKDSENNDMKSKDEQVNGKSENGSIDSLEANVSGSHIVNINDLEDNGSIHDAPDISRDKDINDFRPSAPIMAVVNSVENMVDKAQDKIEDVVKDVKDTASELKDKVKDTASDIKDKMNEKVEVVEEMLEKTVTKIKPGLHCGDDKRVLEIPDVTAEVQNSPPPKTPILPELLQLPDMTELSPNLSRSDDGQSENETIACDSDKSSPQAKTKTQAVMPIKRSDDIIDLQSPPEHNEDVVVNKMEERGRFSKIFQSIKDKENSCMSKGKVIEEKVTEQVHKTIEGAEDTVHKVEETVETEIRNQTNSRACTIL